MGGRKTLSAQDLESWTAFARLVTPLAGRSGPQAEAGGATGREALPPSQPSPPPGPEMPLDSVVPPIAPPVARPPPPLVVGLRAPGIDERRWRGLAARGFRVERRLDLHGHTLDAALRAVEAFLQHAASDGVRAVEIVTGRGGEGGGAIRREFPHWLNLPSLRPLVLAARTPHPANPGAVRLLLRKRGTR